MGAVTRLGACLCCWCGALGLVGAAVPVRAQALPEPYVAALQAMEQQDWASARALLQQTLQQQPQMAGAWLDLALVACAEGDWTRADELLISLSEQFAPLPFQIQQTVQLLRQRIDAQLANVNPVVSDESSARMSQTTFLLAAGHDSNANAGLRVGAITLNLPGGDLVLPLDASSRPSPAAFWRAAWANVGQGQWQGRTWVWQLAAQSRQYPRLSDRNSLELQGQIRTHIAPDTWAGATWRSVRVGGEEVFQAPGLYWLQKGTQPCHWAQRVQYDAKHYPRAAVLDSSSLLYRLELDCAAANQGNGWFGQAEAAWDLPQSADRPGGQTLQTRVQVGRSWNHVFGWVGHQLHASAEWSLSHDTSAYSAWLDNGGRRSMQRTEWQLSWLLPAGSGEAQVWRWAVSLQGYQQHSNIALFDLTGNTFQLALWRDW